MDNQELHESLHVHFRDLVQGSVPTEVTDGSEAEDGDSDWLWAIVATKIIADAYSALLIQQETDPTRTMPLPPVARTPDDPVINQMLEEYRTEWMTQVPVMLRKNPGKGRMIAHLMNPAKHDPVGRYRACYEDLCLIMDALSGDRAESTGNLVRLVIGVGKPESEIDSVDWTVSWDKKEHKEGRPRIQRVPLTSILVTVVLDPITAEHRDFLNLLHPLVLGFGALNWTAYGGMHGCLALSPAGIDASREHLAIAAQTVVSFAGTAKDKVAGYATMIENIAARFG